MAPLQTINNSRRISSSSSRLEIPTAMADHTSSSTLAPLYTSSATSSSKTELNTNLELEFELESSESPVSPRALYAQSFDRPGSSQSLPNTRRFRKNMKEMTGFGTTEEEFEALPIAVRRKVRVVKPLLFCLCSLRQACKIPICDQCPLAQEGHQVVAYGHISSNRKHSDFSNIEGSEHRRRHYIQHPSGNNSQQPSSRLKLRTVVHV